MAEVDAAAVEARLRGQLGEGTEVQVADISGCARGCLASAAGGVCICTAALRPSTVAPTPTCPAPHLPALTHSCGASFEVRVVSPAFEGQRLLERHKAVNAALAPLLPAIHALSIKQAKTPAEVAKTPTAQ